MSRLLLRIDRELSSESNEIKRAELIAQRAAYHARIGRFNEAKSAVAELRSRFGDGHSGPITVRIMIAEAMIQLFENLHPEAIDRIQRAQFLSNLMQDKSLIALTSAWKAHIEFENSRFEIMFESLSLVRDNLGESDHSARARYSMVLCDLAYLCGDHVRGQVWFMQSREAALQDGDQASIEALLYNKAAFRLAWFRAQRCLGEVPTAELERLRVEIASARNFQELVGIAALVEFSALCEARLLILLGRLEEAIAGLVSVRTRGPFATYNFSQPLIDLEIAYCYAHGNRLDDALRHFESAKTVKIAGLDNDEQLVTYWMNLELAKMSHQFGDVSRIHAEFSNSVERYRKQLNTLSSGFSRFVV